MAEDADDAFRLVGTRIGDKYVVERVVGEGGFGVVYRAMHEGFDAPVAIKCLKLPAHMGASAREMLVRQLREEGRLLLRLSQRTTGIVQALDVGTHVTREGARVPFLVLEWLEGRTLADDLRARQRAGTGGRSLRQARDLLAPAAKALAVAHAEKIAHRDIKPENLMLLGEGERATLKILDFGIAKILDEVATADEAKTSGAPMFSPGYAAPEQFQKTRGASGPWSDVFALALVFVEVVSGKRPLAGDDFMAVFQKTADPAARPTLRSVGVDATEGVEAVLSSALAVEPRDRYADATKFWDALSKAVDAAPDARLLVTARTGEHEAEDAGVSTDEFVDRRARESGRSADGTAPHSASKGSDSDRGSTERDARSGDIGSARTERATTKNPVVSSARDPGARSPRRWPWIVGGVVAVGLVAGGVARVVRNAARRPLSASSAPVPSAAASTAVVDAPVSSNPEAAALYTEGLQAWRRGAPDSAVDAFEKAVTADRTLAAAELRLALWTLSRNAAKAREHFDHARFHASSLGPKDTGLLDAAALLMNQPEDGPGYEQKLAALSDAYPDDTELLALLAQARLHLHRADDALAAVEKALAIDGANVACWSFRGEAYAQKGDAAGRLDSYEKCVRAEPRAAECLLQIVNARSSLGQCPEMLDAAKRYVGVATTSARAYHVLALALHATGAAPEAVNEALNHSLTLLSESERARATARDKAYLAIDAGDFAGALSFADQWSDAVAAETDQNSHLEPAVLALDIDRETGHLDDAAKRADAIAARMGAWTERSSGDWTLALDRYRLLAHTMKPEDFDAARDAWSAAVRKKRDPSGMKADGELEWLLWSNGYGSLVTDGASATLAIVHLPDQVSLLESGRYASFDVMAGGAYALDDKPALAKPMLQRATQNCSFPMTDPILATVGWYYLGRALEGSGDRDGARKAYERVQARWGKATPTSVTAAAAAARLANLATGSAGDPPSQDPR